MPTPRSGHSFTYIGGVNYLLYGGIDNSKKSGGKIMPNNDVYMMKVGSSKYYQLTDISTDFCGEIVVDPLVSRLQPMPY